MKTSLLIAPLALATGLLVSCKNPADDTTDAQVGAAKDKKLDSGPEGAVKYVFTDASKLEFEGSKVTGSHSGGFKTFTGHFTIKDGEPVGNDHKVEIDMDSLYSDSEKLTGHLKAPDFFNVEQFPTSTFDVTEIKKSGETTYSVTGNLTLHGVTKSVTFPADVSQSGDLAKITAEFDINRFDWEIVYEGKKDDLIRKEVILRFDLEAKPE